MEKKLSVEHHHRCNNCTVRVVLKMLFYLKFQLVGESIPLITLNVQGKFMQFILNVFGTHGKAEVPTF